MSAVNDERRQVLPSKVVWDGIINSFEVFRQLDAVYLFD
jgi:hypothetical protein